MQIKLDGDGSPRVQIVANPHLAKRSLAEQSIQTVSRNLRRRNCSPQAQLFGSHLLPNSLVKRVVKRIWIRN